MGVSVYIYLLKMLIQEYLTQLQLYLCTAFGNINQSRLLGQSFLMIIMATHGTLTG